MSIPAGLTLAVAVVLAMPGRPRLERGNGKEFSWIAAAAVQSLGVLVVLSDLLPRAATQVAAVVLLLTVCTSSVLALLATFLDRASRSA